MTYASWDLLFGKINYYLGVLNLLPGSKKYQGKFNAEEAEIIERIMKKYNLNANQLVRRSVMLAIQRTEYEDVLKKNPEVLKIFKDYYEYFGKLLEKPSEAKRLEKALKKIGNKAIEKAEKQSLEIDNDMSKLLTEKKPGRPKIKKKRGRPKKR